MAKVKGDVGQVKFDDDGSSVNPVLGTTSWSMSITKDIQEITAQGDTFKAFVGGLIEGEGTAELLYDDSASGETATFVDGVLTTGDLGTASFELFPDSSSATKKISFNGIITSFDQSSTLGEANTISITFKPTGTITSAI
jgi:hypothetical protein|tara:strand:+ start:3815 stop:4234 length:420 start_codon:yes stop_codon:yes gene_type:complete